MTNFYGRSQKWPMQRNKRRNSKRSLAGWFYDHVNDVQRCGECARSPTFGGDERQSFSILFDCGMCVQAMLKWTCVHQPMSGISCDGTYGNSRHPDPGVVGGFKFLHRR